MPPSWCVPRKWTAHLIPLVLLAYTVWFPAFDLDHLKGLYIPAVLEHTVQRPQLLILREQAIKRTPVFETSKMHLQETRFKLSLIPWLYPWGWVVRSGLELWSGTALYFLSDRITPAWPQMSLALVGKHHLSLIIKKWEEENVNIPIDNTCTVPACVTISCVLPSPIWKPTR